MRTLALLTMASMAASPSGPPSRTRTYCVAADEVTWNYTPTGKNEVTGRPFDAIEQRTS